MKVSDYFSEKEKTAEAMTKRSLQAGLSQATVDAWRAEQHAYVRARIAQERFEANLLQFAASLPDALRVGLEVLVTTAADAIPSSASPVQRAQIW